MSAAPSGLVPDEHMDQVGWSIAQVVLGFILAVCLAFGCFWAILRIGSYSGDPNSPSLRLVMMWCLVGVAQVSVLTCICLRSQLLLLTGTWAMIASGLLYLTDSAGLTMFGAMQAIYLDALTA